ncbi:MAG: ABC transporter permease [Planctomycetota bacterium]|nr:ABC transporter permease [Planctomycetota bacterium]
MASKAILVAQREYLENVRTKTFWIGILAFPILFGIAIGAGWVLNKLKETKTYAVIEYGDTGLADRIERQARSGDLEAFATLLRESTELRGAVAQVQKDYGASLAEASEPGDMPDGLSESLFDAWMDLPSSEVERLTETTKGFEQAKKYRHVSLEELEIDDLPPEEQEKRLAELVNQDELFAYFTLGSDPEESLDGFNYTSNNVTDSDLRTWYGNAATQVVQKLRIDDTGISKAIAQKLQERVRFYEQKVGESGETEQVKAGDKANKYAPVAFVYLLWIAVFTAAQMLLTNTVEEKSNRIIEVLLSSVSPLQLMSGKIWGIAATGLTIVGSWVLCALLGVMLLPVFVPGLDLPLMQVVGDPLYLVSFVAYFLAGYLLFAAILVGIGSVCNSLKEAQNLLQPVFILLIVPLISMMFIVQEPNGLVAKVLSYIPLFTPFTMMNRAGGPPETYEYVITSILLVISVWLAFKAAGKVFRVGVLMTGKPPKMREILSWLRE